ncbi:hypothetical protein JOC70_003063 [Clostridium pascui]|uniref:DUF2812 domain-containing protein n=1 Tax=Clostridium pascui TaxID=46609 RepID=UPI00195D61AB|nr:DUF2812 domain-containing protein [Clostridium pascui]MBM7871563.1 hypothetical protein [Clostridium pascui]
MINKFKIFINPIEGQEKWLNEKAKEGFRLSKAGRFIYKFEKSEPMKYQYAVDYVGNKTIAERKEYENFLGEVEIKYFQKPLNLGQFSLGRVKYRPYANPGGKMATSQGMINRELLILEKRNNGKPFDIYSNVRDKIMSLRERRKPYIYLFTFMLLMELHISYIDKSLINISYWSNGNISVLDNTALSILAGVIGIISVIRIMQLSLSIKTLKARGNIHE